MALLGENKERHKPAFPPGASSCALGWWAEGGQGSGGITPPPIRAGPVELLRTPWKPQIPNISELYITHVQIFLQINDNIEQNEGPRMLPSSLQLEIIIANTWVRTAFRNLLDTLHKKMILLPFPLDYISDRCSL